MKKYIAIFIGIGLLLCSLPTISIAPSNEEYNYVIITKEELFESITSSSFIDWKTSIGFSIKAWISAPAAPLARGHAVSAC